MKKFISLLIISLSFLPAILAQDCDMYYPLKEGTTLQTKNYDAKNKLTGIVNQKVSKVNKLANGVEVAIQSQMLDKDQKELFNGEFTARCENGVYTVDMKNMINPSTMAGFKDMTVSIEGDNLDIPRNAKPGDMLKGGKLTMKVTTQSGVNIMNMTMTVSNRQVEAIEDVTTPAGTFKCVKISYEVETKMLMTMKSKAVEFYAKDIGLVRSESYNKSGKLAGYNVLSSITK
jgi:hypothetical protein